MRDEPNRAPRELPILPFATRRAWAAWLGKHHASAPGVQLKLSKKGSGIASVTYEEAVEEALCYGWIDGRKDAFDSSWWLQKFTPRGAKSIWSRRNREKAVALIESGKMKPSGLAEVERAKRDGRWEAAYESQKEAVVPADLLSEIERRPKARDFFASLDSANRYAILFRLHTAKTPETREKRLLAFVQMLEKGEKIHP